MPKHAINVDTADVPHMVRALGHVIEDALRAGARGEATDMGLLRAVHATHALQSLAGREDRDPLLGEVDARWTIHALDRLAAHDRLADTDLDARDGLWAVRQRLYNAREEMRP